MSKEGSSRPLVSIGIPTYNRANGFLREALACALAQTYSNIEIIVSDNCSPDNTREVVAEYTDPRIRYFRHEQGLVPNENFNFCLAQARGAYFLLLPDDDLIDKDFVESCMQAVDYRTDVGVIRSSVRTINREGTVINAGRNDVVGLPTGDFFLAWFEGRTALYLCATLLNTPAFRAIGGMRSRHNLFQDVMATVRVAVQHGRVDLPDVKASARWHGGKWTHVGRVKEWCEDSLELLDLLCQLAPDKSNEVRERGLQFFADVNYSRASDVHALFERIKAYQIVYRFFGRRYFPSAGMVFHSTAIYRGLRQVKRKILRLPAWVD